LQTDQKYRFQEKEFFAELRGAPSQASDRQAVARKGAPRTAKNISLNALPSQNFFARP
jgi:hypothetical protein